MHRDSRARASQSAASCGASMRMPGSRRKKQFVSKMPPVKVSSCMSEARCCAREASADEAHAMPLTASSKKSGLRFRRILSVCSAVSQAPKSLDEISSFPLPPAGVRRCSSPPPASRRTSRIPAQIEISVGRLLEQGHYSRKKLDEKVSQHLSQELPRGARLQPPLLHAEGRRSFHGEVRHHAGQRHPARQPGAGVHDLRHLQEARRGARGQGEGTAQAEVRVHRATAPCEINRQKAPWPKDEAEADQLWRDRDRGRAAPGDAEQARGRSAGENAHPALRPDPAQSARAEQGGRHQELPHHARADLRSALRIHEPLGAGELPDQHAALARRHRRGAALRGRLRQDRGTRARRPGVEGWAAQGRRPRHRRGAGRQGLRRCRGHEARQGRRDDPRQEGHRSSACRSSR